jgi:replicative DNA helicase
MLNYHLAGVHKRNLILHLAGIGQGKTTSALLMYVLPIIESGESVCIIANEQGQEEFRQMLLATVLFNKIRYFKMNRQKLLFGGFTPDDKVALKQATEWLKQYENKLHYVHLNDYDISNVKRIIKKYSKLNVGAFLFDTLKPRDDSSDKAWADFSEVSKELFLLAQKEDVAVIATAQLASSAANRKYLDLSCVGKSRAIAETAGQVIMFRPLKENEKEKLKVYSYAKDNNGKYTNIKKEHVLDSDKDYVVLFVPKNRYGKAGDLQIVYERNMDFNTMKEIGYCHIEYDGFGK